MDVTVGGRKVTFRERYPVAEYSGLRKRLMAMDENAEWDARAKCLRDFVEAWEFDGDPGDVQAWGQLDYFEMQAIENAVAQEIIAKRAEYQKNSTSGPIEGSQDESP